MAIDADPSSPTMNAYCDLTFANAYFTFRFGADAWTDGTFSDEQKEALIVRATNTLDTFRYGGFKTDRTQPLKWPRAGLVDDDAVPVPDDSVPTKMKQATCEFAFWMWTEDDRLMSDTDLRQLDSFKVGPLDVKAKKGAVVYPPIALDMIRSMGQGFLLATGDDGSAQNARIYL